MKKRLEEHLYNPELFYDPKQPEPQCALWASGIDFDPDAFLKDSNFSPQNKMIKGIIGLPDEIRGKIKRRELSDDTKEKIQQGFLTENEFFKGFELFETPFLFIRISKAAKYVVQLDQTISFLKTYEEDLVKLCKRSDVEDVQMRFSAEDYDHYKEQDFPDEFYALISKIGVQFILFE